MTHISDRRLAIAIVAPSLDVLGGQGIQAQALLDGLTGDGYLANLIPINPRFPRPAQWLRDYRYLRTVLNEALYISTLRELHRADIVHVFAASYWSFLLAPAPAILAAKLLRKPVILHYHSGEASDHLARWPSVGRFLRLVERIVVPSPYLQAVFESHGYRATVIPNVIDASQYQYRERAPLQPFLLSVRNLEDHYRIENTVFAFARVKARYPEAALTIAGYGSRERHLQRLVEHLGIAGVRFVGRVEPTQLPALYESAHVFLNSSVVDNQPVSILEALAAGLPVVSTPTGDIERMLCGGEAGLLVAPEDPAAMAEAVVKLIEHPDLASRIARRGREEVERHKWPAVRDQWSAIYRAAIKTESQKKPSHTLQRVLQMDRAEIAGRARQEAFKRVERLTASCQRVLPARPRGRKSAAYSLDRFVENAERRFFNGVFDPHLPMMLALVAPQHCRELIAAADKLCRGSFDLLGYSNLEFGDPPNWHLDPISGNKAPLMHWTRLDPTDYATVGDTKVVWEFNRHQWLVHLAQAYRLTREERYAAAAVRYLQSWLHANPEGIGINWTSSLELALRIIAWCWTLLLIRDSRAMTPTFFGEMVESVQSHAKHIERYLSYYFSPNTHLTGEALGLLYGGLLFTELKDAERWRALAIQILERESERQILSDGVYFELSTCYQRYTVDTYLQLLNLAASSFDISPSIHERVRSLLDFLITIGHPDASIPSIGDADGGWLLPLGKTHSQDVQPTFSTAAVFFKEPHYAAAARRLAPDTLWLLGTPAAETFESIQPSLPSETCRMFTAGGYSVMRTGWDEDSHSLIFDTGPLGAPIRSGHEHADLLSVQCAIFGKAYIVDAGTCCYIADQELRNFCRGTSAHSTVVIDRKCQAEPAGPFSWEQRARAQLLGWFSNDELAFVDATHDGYSALPEPVFHRRRVILVKPRYWVLIDDLTGVGRHQVDIRFQFATMDVYTDSTGWTRSTLDGQRGLIMRVFATEEIEPYIRVGCRAPLEGWIAPDYGQLEPAPALVYTVRSAVPLRIVTLLWPSSDVNVETPSVSVIHDKNGRIAGLEFPDRAEVLMFEDGEPVIERTAIPVAEAS